MRQIISNRVQELVAIKARREQRNIRKFTIEQETGLNRRTIDGWFANEVTRYDADVILIWCNFLGCTISELLVVEEIPEKQSLLTHSTSDFSVVAMN